MKICKKCKIDKDVNEFHKHKGVCKECRSDIMKEWRLKNKDKVKNQSHKWYLENKERRRKPRRDYAKIRRKNDPIFALRSRISSLIRTSLIRKNSNTTEILGCSLEEFKSYIESKFESWMTWENRGLYNGEFNYGWDLDHIIPISSVNSEEEMIKLNHYTNFQPLCSKINRDIKKNKPDYYS